MLPFMPLAAICPVHGAFPTNIVNGNGAKNITISIDSTNCPQCGRRSRVAQGIFDFDENGQIEVVDAPQWSRDAIAAVQPNLEKLGSVLNNPRISDTRAIRALEYQVDQIRATQDSQATEIADYIESNVERQPTLRKKRNRAIAIIGGILLSVTQYGPIHDGAVAIAEDAQSVIQIVNDAVHSTPTEAPLAPPVPADGTGRSPTPEL